jgi:hypothetical protein
MGKLIRGERQFARELGATPKYTAWMNAKTDCYDPKRWDYKNYGGRGIRIYEGWVNDFSAFLDSVGRRPTNTHTLGRIDNDGDYKPGNVEWQTRSEQQRNRRNSNVETRKGAKLTYAKACKIRQLYSQGYHTHQSLAIRFSVSESMIGWIVKNKRWVQHQ